MQLGKCELQNFCSYPELAFDFSSVGLGLIAGNVGSGKSTVQDGPCWILFGQTSKDGAADDVKSWGADQPTCGRQEVHTPQGSLSVTRIRGKSTQNDLYWTEENLPTEKRRGKDLVETQKLLNERLGVDPELYMLGGYFHQFSEAGAFFIAKAKDRRSVLERIADVSLAVNLATATSDARSALKKVITSKTSELDKAKGSLDQLEISLVECGESGNKWETTHDKDIAVLEVKSKGFADAQSKKVDASIARLEEFDTLISDPGTFKPRLEQARKQLEAAEALRPKQSKASEAVLITRTKLDAAIAEHAKLEKSKTSKCTLCKTVLTKTVSEERLKELKVIEEELTPRLAEEEAELARLDLALAAGDKVRKAYDKIKDEQVTNNQYIAAETAEKEVLKTIQAEKNQYGEQVKTERSKVNPFTAQARAIEEKIFKAEFDVVNKSGGITELEHKSAALSLLYDLSFKLRIELLRKSVRELQNATNKYLEKYFEGMIRIKFSLDDTDKLDVDIQKSGWPCTFKQLSGGQRCMLKLSFSIGLMLAAQNRAGVAISPLFFDEALYGLNDEMKVQAFGIFEELETLFDSVIMIDHCPAFKSMFSKQFLVTMTGDVSSIKEYRGEEEVRQAKAA